MGEFTQRGRDVGRQAHMSNIPPLSRSRNHERLDDEGRPPAASQPPFRREYSISPAITRHNDALLAQFVHNATPAAPATRAAPARRAPVGPTNDQILYVGVNPDSRATESEALRRLRGDTKVVFASRGDAVTHGGTTFDLSSPAGRTDFVAKLGLRGKQAEDVARVLDQTTTNGRSTVGQLAIRWSAAERGEPVPSRLLLSGHSSGNYVAGGETQLDFSQVLSLAKALPEAARQIEDVHLSGCFTYGQAINEDHLAKWRDAFPNMKTLWTYAGLAPAAPLHHFAAWETATRGRNDRWMPAAWLRDQEVACWSAKNGFISKEVTPEAMERSKRAADAAFEGLMAGTPRIELPGDSRAIGHYDTYRALSKRPERDDTAALGARADQLLAIRHYEPTIRGKVAIEYGSRIESGYRAVGLEPPNFGALTRAEALQETRKFHAAVARISPVPDAARTLEPILRGLDTLEPPIIRPEWSTHGAAR